MPTLDGILSRFTPFAFEFLIGVVLALLALTALLPKVVLSAWIVAPGCATLVVPFDGVGKLKFESSEDHLGLTRSSPSS